MVLAHRDFRDEEYFIPRNIFQSNGFTIVTVSNSNEKAVGMFGGEAKVDLIIANLNPQDFDAVLFIGGSGSVNYLDNLDFHNTARKTLESNKVLGAICFAPAILAKAGVLKGKKATVWSDTMNKKAVRILQENGAIYQNEPVVVDGKIITANGPVAAEKFGQTVFGVLTGQL